MNGLKLGTNFLAKLTALAAVLLFSQQTFAAGTTAGTDVDNLATVSYEVNTVLQTVIESAPGLGNSNPGAGNGTITSFEVDNRVDFTLVQVGGAHTVVSAGETDQYVEFLLTNVGNSVQDFRLFATQLDNPEAVFGRDDTDDDIGNLRVRVGVGGDPAGAPPTPASDDFVDELGEDESVIIYLYGDDLGGLVHDDVMNIDLTAVVAEGGTAGGGAPGADLIDDLGNADDPDAIDVVFADGAVLGDGTETERHGFVFESAGLNVSKVVSVISDPFNGTTDPKAVPGAIVEYVITVTNSGTGVLDAENVSISDDIDGDVTLITDFYAGQDLEVDINGSIQALCNADALDTDSDGCALDTLALTIGNGNLAITLEEDESLIVTYRVLIPL